MTSPHTCEYCYNLDLQNKRKYQEEYRCKVLSKYVTLKDGRSCHYWQDKFDSRTGYGRSKLISILKDKFKWNNNGLLLDLFQNIVNNIYLYDQELIPELTKYNELEDLITENIINMDYEIPFLNNLITNFIIPCVNYFQNSSIFDSILTYQNMLKYLCNFFGLNLNPQKRTLEHSYI